MVKIIFCFWLVLFHSIYADPQDIKVSLKLDRVVFSESSDITGVIDIQHTESDKIDPKNFTSNGKAFPVEFVKKVTIDAITTPLAVSLYKFKIPPQPVGLYLFPTVEIKIGGKTYKTAPASYEVKRILDVNEPKEGFLKLVSFIDSSKKIYPSQKIRLGYRIFYNENFYLDELVLPLLNPKGFKKLNKEKIVEAKEGSVSMREVFVDVQAISPGKYTLGPSYIIGIVTSKGKSKKVKAEAENIVIDVLNFPLDKKPPSFNGSIGEDLSFHASLQGFKEVYVGDKISLLLSFKGQGDLSQIKIPELCCLPGFPGFFQIGDMPSIPSIEKNKVDYLIDIKPLNDKVKEIPPIDFSYFNPVEEKYYTLKSEAIPILVSSPKQEQKPKQKEENYQWPKLTRNIIEIRTIYPLTSNNLKNYPLGSWHALWIIPLGIIAIIFQIELRKREAIKGESKYDSKKVFDDAKKTKTISSLIHLLQKAFLLKLYENGLIDQSNVTIEDLSEEGLEGKIKAFFVDLEKKHFSGKIKVDKELILKDAEILFNEIKEKE